MRRHIGNLSRALRLTDTKVDSNANLAKTQFEVVLSIQKDVSYFNTKEKYESVDILHFFPITSNTLLLEFMSRADGMFLDRKLQFEYYMTSCATQDKDMDSFVCNVIANVFSRAYIKDYKWPCNE